MLQYILNVSNLASPPYSDAIVFFARPYYYPDSSNKILAIDILYDGGDSTKSTRSYIVNAMRTYITDVDRKYPNEQELTAFMKKENGSSSSMLEISYCKIFEF